MRINVYAEELPDERRVRRVHKMQRINAERRAKKAAEASA